MADDNALKDASVKTLAANWLLGQPFNNVILVAILASGGWAFWYGITKAIPDHLTTIQAGYEKIESRQSEQLKDQQATFEKTLDRVFERRVATTAAAASGSTPSEGQN